MASFSAKRFGLALCLNDQEENDCERTVCSVDDGGSVLGVWREGQCPDSTGKHA